MQEVKKKVVVVAKTVELLVEFEGVYEVYDTPLFLKELE
jgi:hypothetical protein